MKLTSAKKPGPGASSSLSRPQRKAASSVKATVGTTTKDSLSVSSEAKSGDSTSPVNFVAWGDEPERSSFRERMKGRRQSENVVIVPKGQEDPRSFSERVASVFGVDSNPKYERPQEGTPMAQLLESFEQLDSPEGRQNLKDEGKRLMEAFTKNNDYKCEQTKTDGKPVTWCAKRDHFDSIKMEMGF